MGDQKTPLRNRLIWVAEIRSLHLVQFSFFRPF
jgi:hypothetical protein